MLMWWPISSTMTACRWRLVGPNDQRGMRQACLTMGLILVVTAASTAAALECCVNCHRIELVFGVLC
jgi:hypothetical protein